MNRRVIVTGGAGRLGRFVVAELAEAGAEVVVLDVRPPAVSSPGSVRFVECDLTNLENARRQIRDADAVVHLAAIPDPFSDPPDRVMGVNSVLTLNVCEACKSNGVRRVVYGSSESATGFGIHEVEHRPLWLPIDESHPCRPHETYSLSKYFGEIMVAEFARAGWIDAVSLRYSWVWLPSCADAVFRIVEAGRSGCVSDRPWFGSWVAPQDVATAIRCSLNYLFAKPGDGSWFETFFVTARDTFLPIPTLEALRRHFDPLPEVRDPAYFQENPYASVFDIRKAERLLQWSPQCRWQNIEDWFVR